MKPKGHFEINWTLATAELLITIAQFYPDFILDNYIWIKLIRRWTDLILISNYSNPNGLNGNTRIAQNPEIQNGGGVHSRENTLSRDVHHITVSTKTGNMHIYYIQ